MNILEELRWNRAVYAAAFSAAERGDGEERPARGAPSATTPLGAEPLQAAKPPPTAPQARWGGSAVEADGGRRADGEAYSLRWTGPGDGAAAQSGEAVLVTKCAASTGAARYPEGDAPDRPEDDGDGVNWLLRQMEADARLESQLLEEP